MCMRVCVCAPPRALPALASLAAADGTERLRRAPSPRSATSWPSASSRAITASTSTTASRRRTPTTTASGSAPRPAACCPSGRRGPARAASAEWWALCAGPTPSSRASILLCRTWWSATAGRSRRAPCPLRPPARLLQLRGLGALRLAQPPDRTAPSRDACARSCPISTG